MKVWPQLLFCLLAMKPLAVMCLSLERDEGCEYDNKRYPLNTRIETNDPCLHVFCDSNGQLETEQECCDDIPCARPVYVEGKCCQDCPYGVECFFNGTYYKPNDEFVIARCTHGICNEMGDIEEMDIACAPAQCNNAIQTDCCDECPDGPGCEYKGKFYQINSDVPSDNPCEFITCEENGELSRAMASCPYCDRPVNVPGQCCSDCSYDYPTPTENPYSPSPPTPASVEPSQTPTSKESPQSPSSSETPTPATNTRPTRTTRKANKKTSKKNVSKPQKKVVRSQKPKKPKNPHGKRSYLKRSRTFNGY